VFPSILFTCPNHHSHSSSITSKIFLPTSMIALVMPFRTFPFFDFLADLQKSVSVASNSLAC
jgi:hypothetical protein